ncbi:MAG TPA: sialidase family protein, partial [Actinomycetota bacterium]|nr:sialidase family protein [Actinomycetota bacterium]
TPSRNIGGIFQDKPMLEVDRTGGDTDGNVYVCWSRYPGGAGKNKIYFSRSTDMGDTFSKPIQISGGPAMGYVQGCDIAVESDGDVYVTWRTFTGPSATAADGLAFARSTDGGVSFSSARLIRNITPYFPFDGTRDCGDGAFECPTGYVFARIPLEPRVTADQTGELPGVYLVYNAVDPDSIVEAETSYSSAGAGSVGQSLVYVISTTDDGATWTEEPIAVDADTPGHQFFPDIDALGGTLAVVWQDSREDPCYSVQLPMGNDEGAVACGYPGSPETNVVNSFVAVSDDGETFPVTSKVSDVGHQPQYEMFGGRNIPFQGDYNWISLAQDGTEVFAYFAWTDNRDVVPGEDLREATQDGFDVHQCRTEDALEPDTCPNAGGLDQNIYGNSMTISS